MSQKEQKNILDEAQQYVHSYFKEEMPDDLLFHDILHTEDVVEIVKELGKEADLDSDQLEVLQLAAWFHDIGYAHSYDDHENKSAEIADSFLKKHAYDVDKRKEINSLIKSTRKDALRENIPSQLLHDADIAHIGRKRFFRRGELLRAELENYQNLDVTELEWQERQYDFLIEKQFLTKVAKEKYSKRLAKNIKKQRQQVIKARKVTTRKKTGKNFGRGIDTLYRSNYRTQINLSAIADGKANMMISINTILISVIVTLSGASFSLTGNYIVENLRFTVPILILLIGALASVVFAVLSARPKVTEKEIDYEKVNENEMSLLYFGNFLGIPRQKFVDYLNELKGDQERLYDSMSLDLYNLGLVLREKYRLLTISYNIFMVGLTLTVVAFLGIFIYTNFL